MTPAPSLTKRQRQILALMHRFGAAQFTGLTRSFSWFENDVGVSIRAYQSPEFFLKARGLIAETPTNLPGAWYRLTPEGERRAAGRRVA